MQLCLMIEGQEGVTWPQWLALARACEEHAIDALFRSDHYLNLDGAHPERGSLDAWGTLCALAAVTTDLRLGALVSPATFRHPSELAKLVTTADHVSGGRVELGLGAGWHEREHAAYGFPFPDLGTRMDVLEEQLAVIRGNWSQATHPLPSTESTKPGDPTEPGEPFSFSGAHYKLEQLDARPKPLQARVPLIMGGAAGPRVARLAARYADEYNTAFATADEVRERKGRIDAACDRAGRAPLPFSLMTGVVIGDDDADLRARAARLEQRAGFADGSLLREPPSGWLVGTVEVVADRLRELADAGASRVMCQQLLHDDLDAVALLGDRLAPLVA